jgi:hypothetical protein
MWIWRRWSHVNGVVLHFEPDKVACYVTNAIDALTQAVTLAPSFPDIVQLLNPFFEHADRADVFQSTKCCIENLQPKLLLHASPQLLVQLSHPTQEVADFVHRVLCQWGEKALRFIS